MTVSTHAADPLNVFNHAVQQLMASDPTFRERFERAAARTACAAMREAGHAGPSEDAVIASLRQAPAARSPGISFSASWWGIQLYIPSADLQQFTADATHIVQTLGPVVGASSPWLGLIAGFIATALQLLRSLDHGRGVYINMSYFVPGAFAPTSA